MRFQLKLTCAVAILAASLSHAHAVTFANYVAPAPGSANIALSGTTLSATAPVLFDYTFPSALADIGFVDANLTLNAQESGALGFGPASFGLFSGTFSIAYAGGKVTVGGITLTPGEVLLAGVFQNALFDAMGSAGSVIDSLSGGGTVTYSSALLNRPDGHQSCPLRHQRQTVELRGRLARRIRERRPVGGPGTRDLGADGARLRQSGHCRLWSRPEAARGPKSRLTMGDDEDVRSPPPGGLSCFKPDATIFFGTGDRRALRG
jgi:hypothetical protein